MIAVTPLALLLAAVPVTAFGWGYGLNRMQTAAENDAAETGYGPGWVILTYKPNGPAVGYLFAAEMLGKPSNDHMDIRGTRDGGFGHPTITRWPWGYGHGAFGGCAYAYGTLKFAHVGSFSSSQCTTEPGHTDAVFCHEPAVDPLCTQRGVWGAPEGGPKRVYSLGCDAYANIGAAGAYSSGAPVPAHYLGVVPAGEPMDLRYVTKNRQWVMAKWPAHRFVNEIAWAFFPRSCVSPNAPPPVPCPGGCDDGIDCTDDTCEGGQCVNALAPRCLSPVLAMLADDACGDGVVDAGETCDDGNTVGGDCCSSACTAEAVGTSCGGGCDLKHCDGAGLCQ